MSGLRTKMAKTKATFYCLKNEIYSLLESEECDWHLARSEFSKLGIVFEYFKITSQCNKIMYSYVVGVKRHTHGAKRLWLGAKQPVKWGKWLVAERPWSEMNCYLY